MKPLVSIIVPVYNAEKYISKCIDSIVNQSLTNIEIILVNDGSKDSSLKILNKYSEKDKRIKVIDKKNSGPGATRNVGIREATGKYIGFVDSDDYIESTMYKNLFNVANNNTAQLAMCNYKDTTLPTRKTYIVEHKLESNKLHDRNYIREIIISTFTKDINYGFFSLWNKIYLREWLLEEKLFIDEEREHGEDWWFNINIFMKLERFICTDEALYNYIHINEESLMSKYREEQFDLCLDGRLKVKSIIPEELIDYEKFNRVFVYEFSSYIIRTLENVKDKRKCDKLIYNVMNNEEVIESCKNVVGLPVHFKIIALFIKLGFKRLPVTIYKVLSKMR